MSPQLSLTDFSKEGLRDLLELTETEREVSHGPNMAATESTLELDEQERTRLQKAIQTVAGRR